VSFNPLSQPCLNPSSLLVVKPGAISLPFPFALRWDWRFVAQYSLFLPILVQRNYSRQGTHTQCSSRRGAPRLIKHQRAKPTSLFRQPRKAAGNNSAQQIRALLPHSTYIKCTVTSLNATRRHSTAQYSPVQFYQSSCSLLLLLHRAPASPNLGLQLRRSLLHLGLCHLVHLLALRHRLVQLLVHLVLILVVEVRHRERQHHSWNTTRTRDRTARQTEDRGHITTLCCTRTAAKLCTWPLQHRKLAREACSAGKHSY